MSDELLFTPNGTPFPDATPAAPAGDYGAPADAEAAMGELEQRWDDADFLKLYLGGDRDALKLMTQLHERAFPGAQAAMSDAAPPAAPAAQAFTDALGDDARSSDPLDIATQAAFAPSRGAWEFDGLLHPGQTAQETEEAMQFAQQLHESELPPSIAATFREMGVRAVKAGTYGDRDRLEAGVAAGKAEIARRHPDAAQVIADASAAFEHIIERAPTVAELLWQSGADCTVEGVETLARWWRGRGGS